MSKRLTWALIEGEEQRAYAHTGQNRLEYLSGAASVRRYVEALEKDAAIWRAVREEDDLVSRLESVAMSWCLAGLHDALNRVKRESTKSYADLVDAMRYAMSALAPNPDNANGAGDQRWEDGALAERFAALGVEVRSALDREPDGDPGTDADE